VKVLLYYGFIGKPQMITMHVEKELLRLNIKYPYMRTGALLRELNSAGLIEMEERVGKKSKRPYFLWKFPKASETAKKTSH
jgi:hypothetical protein